MSRARVRPTREETRQRLFEAAAAAFAEHGIGGASVEAITAAGGLTRGAFYSNFASKDELITAMLADHVEQTARRNLELLARHRDPDELRGRPEVGSTAASRIRSAARRCCTWSSSCTRPARPNAVRS